MLRQSVVLPCGSGFRGWALPTQSKLLDTIKQRTSRKIPEAFFKVKNCTEGQLRQLAHEALQDVPQDDWLDEEAMIALEQEIYEELCAEVQRAQDEAQHLEDLQNEEDCALFEQHLLPGVHCPLCRDGRLQNDAGLLRCSNCQEMRVTLMDELLSLDDICEQLGDAEVRHQKGGCLKRGHFE
ncbi:unnamed protein product, partial [Symbiodinium microadriaticum]